MDKDKQGFDWKNQGAVIGQEDIDKIKSMLPPDDFKGIARTATDGQMAKIWETIAMAMTERCIGLQNSIQVYQDRLQNFEKRLNKIDQTATDLIRENESLKKENEALKEKDRFDKMSDTKKMKVFTEVFNGLSGESKEDVNYQDLVTGLVDKGFDEIDSQKIIRQMQANGQIYERRENMFAKA